MEKKQSESYRLLNIFLLESNFKRDITIDLEESGVESDVDIEADDQIVENRMTIVITISFSAGSKGKKGITAKIKMLGIFDQPENPDFLIRGFGKINGPAIIFPFIREHLATVSMKSGISPILLPPINFVKHSEEKKKGKAK